MKYSRLVLGLSALYALIFSYLSLTKYAGGGYTGSDLAIFNQVLWNMVNGGGVWSSLQGHSYFGDHFAPLLYLLAPLYVLWQDPRWLLILQSIILGLTAVPIFYITRHVGAGLAPALRERRHPQGEPLHDRYVFLFSFAWLLNPLLHNINLFEFHVLPFALLFLLSAVHYYFLSFWNGSVSWSDRISKKSSKSLDPIASLQDDKKKNIHLMMIFLFLALLVREDVALVVGAIGVVMCIDVLRGSDCHREGGQATAAILVKRLLRFTRNDKNEKILWVGISLSVVGLLWFVGAQSVIAALSPSGGYQFATYYSWIATTSFADALRHLFSFSNFNLTLAVLLPFVFLPLTRPKWLLLTTPPALAAFLAASSGSVVWQSHLVTLWLPGLVVGTIFVYTHLVQSLQDKELEPVIVPLILTVGVVLSSFVLGPKISNVRARLIAPVQDIPQEVSVAATYQHLAPLSSRAELYDLRYIWLGHQQYSSAPYIYRNPEYVVIAQHDLESYMVQFPTLAWTSAGHESGPERLRGLIADGGYEVAEHPDSVLVFRQVQTPTPEATLTVLDQALERARAVGQRCSGGVEILPDRSVGLLIDSCHNGDTL